MTYFTAGEWPVTYTGTGSPFDQSGFDPAVQEEFEAMAANLLWAWTNRIYGIRTELIRPSRVRTPYRTSLFAGMGPAAAFDALSGTPGWGWLPYYSDGEWLPVLCGECGLASCEEHSDPRAIWLPGPVDAVLEVKVDGIVLDAADYRLDYGHTLVRQDRQTWPLTQDLYAAPDSAGTWSISFQRGVPVPPGGQNAAGLLAIELYKASVQDATCGLPSRVQSITRQGVSMEIVQQTFVRANSEQETWTGIFTIDSWISSVIMRRDYAGITFPGAKRPMGAGFSDGYRR